MRAGRRPACSAPLALAFAASVGAAASASGSDPARSEPRPRARELGLAPGVFAPGPLGAITDVAGVLVGHTTLHEGERVHTGVTAVRPHPGNLFQEKVPAAVFVGNAFGKLAGSTQVRELGTLETPIVLTNTLAVGTAVDAVVAWTLAQPGNESVRSVNAVVGETNDGTLNDIRAQRVTRNDVAAAIEAAAPGPSPRAASAPAAARSPSAGKAASAPPRACCPRAPGATRWACWCRRISAAC
jgi:D-aminopeptidase